MRWTRYVHVTSAVKSRGSQLFFPECVVSVTLFFQSKFLLEIEKLKLDQERSKEAHRNRVKEIEVRFYNVFANLPKIFTHQDD